MSRPPLPATLSAKRTRRPGQNLTSLAPGPRGAVLLPVIPKIPQSELRILVMHADVSGEGGKNFVLHHFLLEVLHPPQWAEYTGCTASGTSLVSVRKVGRGGGDRKLGYSNKPPCFTALQPPSRNNRYN
jgi:hypothetical protein